MLGVAHVHIGDNIHDPTVGLLRQALILTAVTGFHMENRNVQSLCADDRKAGIGISQHQHGIGLKLYHQLVGLCNNIAHGLAQVLAYGIQVYLGIFQLQVLKEHAV